MRLYLSSFGLGSHGQRLLSLVGGGRKAVLINNALDSESVEFRSKAGESAKEELAALGFEVSELDLREHFAGAGDLESKLSGADLVFVRGGNSFVLRRAMRQSGFDGVIGKLLQEDKCVYGGFSAGIVVLAPSLKGIELVDDPEAVPEQYNSDVIWEGLGIIPYSIAPHFQSDHPESDAINRVVAYFLKNNVRFYTLQDGEVILVRGKAQTVLPA